jgi:predicted lipid carrier protein YhbT
MSVLENIKTLFIHSEMKRIRDRIAQYEGVYGSSPVKDILLRRLIETKRTELSIFEKILEAKTSKK